MKILYVVQSYFPATVYGGPIFSIHYAAQALARRKIDISVSTTNADRPGRLNVPVKQWVEFEPHYRVKYYHDTILDRFSWGFARGIRRDIADCDVVHLQDVFSTYALITLYEAARQKKPLVISPRGVFSRWAMGAKRSVFKQFWIKRLMAPRLRAHQAIAWHATSDQEAIDTKVYFPVAQPDVIANGIDHSAFQRVAALSRADWVKRFVSKPVGDDVAIFISMGRVHPVKGLDIGLEALAQLSAKGRKFTYVVAGRDEGATDALKSQADALGIADQVCFVGEILGDEKIQFLKGADLFLFPSRSENFGLACLEALAAGLPVIASKDTPWASLENRGAGRWVENNPSAVAEAIADLPLESLVEMRPAARALAADFGFEAVADRFKALYEQVSLQGAA
jgi:glycosyltransferase involved in cell wall biosynthesis